MMALYKPWLGSVSRLGECWCHSLNQEIQESSVGEAGDQLNFTHVDVNIVMVYGTSVVRGSWQLDRTLVFR